jgi:glycerol kinase
MIDKPAVIQPPRFQLPFVLALDQGTTSSRAIAFDAAGKTVALAQREFAQHFPQPGWVEHDANDIWQTQLAVAREAAAKAVEAASNALQHPNFTSNRPVVGMNAGSNATNSVATVRQPFAAIGITNQRETTVLWDRATGQPVARAIVWQDRRTAKRCDALRAQGFGKRIQAKTGLVLDAYFSGTKLEWLLNHSSQLRQRAERGELCFGTMDSWLAFNLSGGTAHITDASNASRTLLFNIHTGAWDAELLKLFNIPAAVLPQVVPSCGVAAQVSGSLLGLSGSIPIAGMAGDQQAATFGQACFAPGMAKNTYGTGCFMLMNTGNRAVRSRHNLLSTVAWQGPETAANSRAYALEGSVFMAGATVQWLRDGLQIIDRACDVEALAASVPDSGDVVLVPAFAGLGAPYWDGHARGTLVGMTRGTTRAHIARAALDAIALQTADVFVAMKADSGIALTELRVDGGASNNNLLMQLQANVLGVDVVRPVQTETTALGAAYLAGLATGLWASAADISAQWQEAARFKPQSTPAQRQAQLRRWRQAVLRSRGWAAA